MPAGPLQPTLRVLRACYARAAQGEMRKTMAKVKVQVPPEVERDDAVVEAM